MEPRGVAPGSDVESRWFDMRTAAKYLCMTRHAIYDRIPQFWMNLQAGYDLDLATRASADRIKRDVHPREAA